MTFQELETVLAPLSGLRFRPSSLQTHWVGLQDCPVDALGRAVGRATRECKDFPTPAELRAYIDAERRSVVWAEEDRSEPGEPFEVVIPESGRTIRGDRVWKYYCDICSDSGWRNWACGEMGNAKPWAEARWCGRRDGHAGHEWVDECSCAQSNPAVLKRRNAGGGSKETA